MVYLGAKTKVSDQICTILQKVIDDNNVNYYIEPFVGGANIIDKIQCNYKIGYDKSFTLIELLKQAQNNPKAIKEECTKEEFALARTWKRQGGLLPQGWAAADIGAIEWLGSFGTRGFPGGFANPKNGRDYYQERKNNLLAQAPNLKGIIFKASNYQDIDTSNWNNCVIYCDPPYEGTKTYDYANEAKFDYTHFWSWVREISKNNYVFVSEMNAPEDFEDIWGKTLIRNISEKKNVLADEKLFVYKDGLAYGNV